MINTLPDFNAVVERLKRPAKTLLLQPAGPDGDSMGSIVALGLGLETLGHTVTMSHVEPIPKSLKFLPAIGKFRDRPPLAEHDLVIGVDMGDFARSGYLDELKQEPHAADSKYGRFVINIDHHPSQLLGDVNLIDISAAATTEMVYDLLTALKVPITRDMAVGILTGLVADTGSFQHANTSARAYEIAGQCLLAGARISKILRHTYHNKTLAALKLWGRALARTEVNPQTKMALSVITQQDLDECGATLEDLEGVVTVINKAAEGKFTLLLTEKDLNTIKGSLRSEEDKGIDVSKIAGSLGGGGHRLASGFTMQGKIVREGNRWRVTGKDMETLTQSMLKSQAE